VLKTCIYGTDVIIGKSHALEDIACNGPVCATMDVIESLSNILVFILACIHATKKYTTYTTSVLICCRSVRFYCKHYGTYWRCTVAAVSAVKEATK